MSDLTTKAVVKTQIAARTWRDTTVEAMTRRSDRGQTAVEYLGIIAVVVLIVAAILGTDIGTTIYNAIKAQVAKVAK